MGVALGLFAAPASAATLKADYRFQNTRASDVAGAPALTDIGPGANVFATETVEGQARRVLAFPKSNGLSLPAVASLIPTTSYSLVIDVRLAEIAGYRRLAGFKDDTSDSGLYELNGRISVYPVASGGSGLIRANTYARVAITRAPSRTVAAYVDGRRAVAPFTDSNNVTQISAANLRFFKDDGFIAGEESAGAVARIRVYDGALTAAEVAALSPVPPPVIGRAVNVQAVRGRVRVALPAGAAGGPARASQKGLRFVPLEQARQIPVGSVLDTRKGTVRLRSARSGAGATQSGDFTAGVFQVLQSRARRSKGLTELRLKGSSFRRCSARGANRAQAAARRLSKRAIRRLRARAKGRFRTRGRYSSATVRGTNWITTDRCDGTLTKVTRGRVAVRDFKRRRTISLRRGKSYLARARR